MKKEIITAKTGEGQESRAEVSLPEDLNEARQTWGDAQVLDLALKAWRVQLQAAMRRWMDADLSDAEIAVRAAALKPGVRTKGIDPVAAVLAKAKGMTKSEIEQFIAQLKAQIATQ